MISEGGSKAAHRFAFYSGVAALLAFIECNGPILVTAILTIFGIALSINPHVQAVLISLFAILTSAFIYKGFKQHHKIGPLSLGGIGALVIILTMYISYSKLIESAGLLALVVPLDGIGMLFIEQHPRLKPNQRLPYNLPIFSAQGERKMCRVDSFCYVSSVVATLSTWPDVG